jgi:hypothetical protein
VEACTHPCFTQYLASWCHHSSRLTSLLGSSNLSVPPTLYVSCARADKHSSTICCAAATCSASTVMVSTCSQQRIHAVAIEPGTGLYFRGWQLTAALTNTHMPSRTNHMQCSCSAMHDHMVLRGKEGNSGGHRSPTFTAVLYTKCTNIINKGVNSLFRA